MSSRRKFLTGSAGAVAGALVTSTSWAAQQNPSPRIINETASLCGVWLFRTDPEDRGIKSEWFGVNAASDGWQLVNVPHTWQVDPSLADYRGVTWYRRTFDLPAKGGSWQDCAVRVEFEAVFHTATVWVNGRPAGEHARKGYTAFILDITKLLEEGRSNTIAVRVDNTFNRHMVPRGRSSDWANDGGIFRPVQLLVTPKVFVESVEVDAVPDLATGDATLKISACIRNISEKKNGRARLPSAWRKTKNSWQC